MLKKMFSILLLFFGLYFNFTKTVYAQSPKKWTGKCVASFDHEVATIQGLECLFYNIL